MGVDDGLALLIADRLLGAGCAISTVAGNVSVNLATRNALLFRTLLGRDGDWPVYRGAACASDGFARDAHDVHGTDGLGGATRALPPEILQAAEVAEAGPFPGQAAPAAAAVTLIGIGPATNIPALVAWYGRDAISRIVLMAGSFFDRGNITPHAEFNAYVDPAALQATLDLGLPTLMIPLDVCRKVQLDRALITACGTLAGPGVMRLIAESHVGYMDFYREREGIEGCFPHDAITILAALEPQRFFRMRGRVTVHCDGERRGHTGFAADAESPVEIVTGGELKWVRTMIRQALAGDQGS
jgi:inosine-uridine nucleoside N-ribohydrolase